MIAGDFNFVTNTSFNKIGGRPNKGTIGAKEQQQMEREFNIIDVWRKTNPDLIGTTWTNVVKGKIKSVKN